MQRQHCFLVASRRNLEAGTVNTAQMGNSRLAMVAGVGQSGGMPMHTPFGKVTWKLDAAQIWFAPIAWFIFWVLGLLDGWGMLLSALFALGAIPLVVLIAIMWQHRGSIGKWALSHMGTGSPDDAAAPESDEDRDSGTALMIFFLDYIVPAVLAQQQLQGFMIQDSQTDNILIRYALGGIKARSRAVEEFWRSFDYLNDAFCSSPQDHVLLKDIIDHIAKIEIYYGYLCGQAEDIATKTGIDYREKYPSDWEEWRSAHSALETAYENEIKRSRRFGRLFRPGRESRWGKVQMPLDS